MSVESMGGNAAALPRRRKVPGGGGGDCRPVRLGRRHLGLCHGRPQFILTILTVICIMDSSVGQFFFAINPLAWSTKCHVAFPGTTNKMFSFVRATKIFSSLAQRSKGAGEHSHSRSRSQFIHYLLQLDTSVTFEKVSSLTCDRVRSNVSLSLAASNNRN